MTNLKLFSYKLRNRSNYKRYEVNFTLSIIPKATEIDILISTMHYHFTVFALTALLLQIIKLLFLLSSPHPSKKNTTKLTYE